MRVVFKREAFGITLPQRVLFWALQGKCEACCWPVVQLDQDEELGPMHGMYGWLEAGLEVQRPIKRAELTAFRASSKKWALRRCRGIISYTSYSRTNDCIYNGYDNINLEPNAMNNIDTVAHMNMHYTQY